MTTGPLVDLEAIRRAVEAATTASAERLPDALLELDQARGILEAATRALVMRAAVLAARPSTETEKLISVSEAARRLGMSEDFVYEHADELPSVRVGGRIKFRAAALAEYARRGRRVEPIRG